MAIVVLYGIIHDLYELYIDDIIIDGASEEEFLENLEKVFKRLLDHNIALNPEKARIGMPEIEYLGHVINSTGTHFSVKQCEKQ